MQKTKRKANIIILAVVTFLCVVFGFFFTQKQDPMKASADMISRVGFYINDEVVISKNASNPYMEFMVYLPENIHENLFTETATRKKWGKKVYVPSEYYLRMRAYDLNGKVIKTEFYHRDPEYAEIESNVIQFCTFNGKLAAKLQFPISGENETQYTYKCSYVRHTDDYSYNDLAFAPNGYILDFVSSLLGLKPKITLLEAEAATAITQSVKDIASSALDKEQGLTTDEINWLNYLAGKSIPTTQYFTVNLKYKKVVDWGNIQEVTEQYQVDSYIAFNRELVYSYVLNARGSSNVIDFNAIYQDPWNGDGIIYLQADGYQYDFDDDADIGTLTIKYRDFQYSNFSIRLQDNDMTNSSHLYVYVRTPDASYDEASDRIFLTFWYDNIVNQLSDGLDWTFKLSAESFVVSNPYDDISVYVGKDYLKVSFAADRYYENLLSEVSITAVAEIIPDFDVLVTYKYLDLNIVDGKIVYGENYQTVTKKYSQFINECNWAQFQKSSNYTSLILNAIEDVGAVGFDYCQPIGVHGIARDDECILEVEYAHRVLFEFTDSAGNISYAAATKNSIIYDLNDFPTIKPKDGERILSLESDSPFVTVDFDESAANDFTIKLNIQASSFTIIPFTVEYSDTWHLNIEYFETYKDTPFALRKTYSKDISLKKYDVNNLTLKDIKSIMGITGNMEVCGLVIPDNKVATEYTSDSTYTAKVSYGMLSLSSIDYDGNKMEIRVPLTSYVDWCNQFGDDLTILFLNRTDKKYFNYSNEVAREDLYGFFTVAVFEEQVSDLNYYFKNNTGTGHVICFDQRTVSGSSAYNFFDRLRDKGPMLSAAGHVGMAFCEIVNDDNKVLHSNFIYLDNTEAYISNGGADNKDDTDDAFDNTVEDIVDKIEDKTETPLKVLRIAVAAVVGLAAVGGLTWCGFWLVARIKETSGGHKKKKAKTRK